VNIFSILSHARSQAHPAPLGATLAASTFLTLASLAAFASSATPASAQAVNFGKVNACPSGAGSPAPCSATQTVTFNIPAGTTIGSIAIVTTGIPDLDFKAKADDSSTTLCKAQHYSSATTCTVDVTFAPMAPGARNGAVELIDGSAAIATTYVYGTGVAPQIAFYPASTVKISNPLGVISTIDAAGNIYAGVGHPSSVEKILATGGYKAIDTINLPVQDGGLGVVSLAAAIDGAGNIFGIEYSTSGGAELFVFEATAASGYQTVKVLGSSGSYGLLGLAVDGSGNLFTTDSLSNVVSELFAASGYTTRRTLGSGFFGPGAIAVDTAGNVFVSDSAPPPSYMPEIKEILAEGGYTTVKLLAGGTPLGVYGSGGLSLDAADNIYTLAWTVTPFTGKPSEILAAGGYTTVVPLPTATGVGQLNVDPSSGNVFFINLANGPGGSTIYTTTELVRSQPPPALDFLNTPVGGVSVDSPKSTQIQNVGNATLTGTSSFSDETDFTTVPGPGLVPDCTPGTISLASSAECNLSFDFTPQSSGLFTSELTLTDNSGNAVDATQTITLAGTGASTTAVPKLSATALNFGSIPYRTTSTQTLTVTNTGTGILTVRPASDGPGFAITGNTCGTGIGAGKSCTVQVEFTPAHLGPNASTVTIWTNTATSPTVPVTGTATGVGSLTTLLQFGNVYGTGHTATQSVMVTNYGVPGAITVDTETSAPFRVTSNGCTAGISSGNSCTVKVEYAPTTAGTVIGYLFLVPSTGPKSYISLEGSFNY
jgi:hypothetical protein